MDTFAGLVCGLLAGAVVGSVFTCLIMLLLVERERYPK